MKVVLTALLVGSTAAFSPGSVLFFGVTKISAPLTTPLFNARVDSSDAVKAALEASQKFGPTSKEARMAWETVEEMDASDNSNAFEAKNLAEECEMTDGELDSACEEYDRKMEELAKLLGEQKSKFQAVKTLAKEIKAVKINQPAVGAATIGPDSSAMKQALEEAKAATEEFGATSQEARLAWEAVEEVASSDNSAATRGTIDEECLTETIEACEALDELSKILDLDED